MSKQSNHGADMNAKVNGWNDSQARTFDVIAISHDGEHVPLTTGTVIWVACDTAKARSRDDAWSAVQVREPGTGRVLATEVNGERQPAGLPPIGQPYRFRCEECGAKMATEPQDPQICNACEAK